MSGGQEYRGAGGFVIVTYILEWCLLGSVLAATYPIVLYPVIMAVIAALRPRPVHRAGITPAVSIVIPAYNEAKCIADTIENKLTQDYPPEKREIIVVSDASDDGTDEIVARYLDRGVKLLRRETRQGKAVALNEAIAQSRGELIVFSDANSIFDRDAVRLLAENFADAKVGYATGVLEYIHQGETSGRGSGAYMRYENWLRRIESRAGSIIGVNGGVGAMRRDLYQTVPSNQMTDFVLPLGVIASGYRVIFDERVHSREDANHQLKSEFRMRVRVGLRALHAMAHVRQDLSVFRSPLAVFCIVSHKVFRYCSFIFLAIALAVGCILAGRSEPFRVLLECQIAFYGLALVGLAGRLPAVLKRLTALPAWFVVTNVAFGVAALRFMRGQSVAIWKPRGG